MSTALPSLDRIRAASEAAEEFLTFAGLVAHFGPSGAVDQLFSLLMPGPKKMRNLLDLFNEHVEVLNDLRERFGLVRSGSPIRRGNKVRFWNPVVYNSAHEAATDAGRMILRLLVEPLAGITNPKQQHRKAKELLANCHEALAFPPDELENLRAMVRDERARFIDRWYGEKTLDLSGAKGEPAPKRTPGRKANPEHDEKIAKEFWNGCYAKPPLWSTQVGYLKTKHKERWKRNANAAKSWLSTLLKRAPYDERAGELN